MEQKLEQLKLLIQIMDRLRVECPWDREQTMESLRTNTIEECYELTDAVLGGDMEQIKKELGDMLLHIVFYSKIAEEQSAFDLGQVARAISEKLIYRHPHVFKDTQANNATAVRQNWEALKLKEKGGNTTVLAGVSKGMPSLSKAYRIGEKVAAVGFDWNKREDVWDKVKEEISEIETEIEHRDQHKLEGEFGDLFFALTNAARLYGVNPDTALERTNRKFIKRFNYLEQHTISRGIPLTSMTLDQMNLLWNKTKEQE